MYVSVESFSIAEKSVLGPAALDLSFIFHQRLLTMILRPIRWPSAVPCTMPIREPALTAPVNMVGVFERNGNPIGVPFVPMKMSWNFSSLMRFLRLLKRS